MQSKDTDARSALTDEHRIAMSLHELTDCAIAVLRMVRFADSGRITEQPDKVGVLLERTANAMTATTECLVKLGELRAQTAKDVTPRRGNDIPLAGTLEAIRRARQGAPS
jgi:hypothetical protein